MSCHFFFLRQPLPLWLIGGSNYGEVAPQPAHFSPAPHSNPLALPTTAPDCGCQGPLGIAGWPWEGRGIHMAEAFALSKWNGIFFSARPNQAPDLSPPCFLCLQASLRGGPWLRLMSFPPCPPLSHPRTDFLFACVQGAPDPLGARAGALRAPQENPNHTGAAGA